MQTTGNSAAFLKQPGRAIGRGDWTVRAALVSHDSDCIGLLAMAIYEQHRDDWMQNYRETFGQAPDDYACYCYELAEHTPRRLAAYRQLAEARLAQSVSPAPIGAKESFLTRLYTAERRKRRRSPGWMRQAGLSG
ncbi:MAG: hypothetical protein JOZ16_11420 [Methylobacteriaceae bacterium]|nr:hypothetical protein [Methylobacteriaceae bacterium]